MPEVIVTTSWDDGHVLDLRLAELLKKYDLRGTFYIAPKNREFKSAELLRDPQIRKLGEDFEIGAHTMTHPRLGKISAKEADWEIGESKIYLENLLQKPVESFCYPGGSYNFINARQVKKHGFRLARTIDRFSFTTGKNPYELPTSIDAYNHYSDVLRIASFTHFNPFKLAVYYRKWDRLAMAMFDRTAKRGGVMHIWGHSWEIDRHGMWESLEKVFAHISKRPDVKYVSNKELI